MTIPLESITPEGKVSYAQDRAVIDALLTALYAVDSEIMWELYASAGNPDAEVCALIATLQALLKNNPELTK